VVATGNVVEDLEAIREAQIPGTYLYDIWERLRLVPWAPPASRLAITCLQEEIPDISDDLLDLLSVTEVPAAGILDFMGPLGTNFGGSLVASSQEVNSCIAPWSFVQSDDLRSRDNDDGWVPDGDLFWFQAQNNNRNLGMAMGGQNDGVVYSMSFGSSIQRIAYRLRDVVACTRELYENGWFRYFDNNERRAPDLEERIVELVMPTVARWHCSPRVACLVRHEEPIRPADL